MFEIIDKNKRITMFIIVAFIILLAAIIYMIGYYNNIDPYIIVPFALIFSMLMSVGTYYYSDRIVLSISRARPATEKEYKHIKDNLEGLCLASGLDTVPKLYIIDDSAPNAFATGRNPKNSVICLTTGLLDSLDMYEIEGVLAHELSHIKNYDVLLSTVVTVLVGMIALLADFFIRGLFFGRRSRGEGRGNPVLMIIGLVLIILAPIFAQLMRFALSRNREFLADATAIEFTRNPKGLMNALSKISGNKEPLESANKATANMYIISPFKGKRKESWLDKLYATHPPIEERIDALKNIH